MTSEIDNPFINPVIIDALRIQRGTPGQEIKARSYLSQFDDNPTLLEGALDAILMTIDKASDDDLKNRVKEIARDTERNRYVREGAAAILASWDYDEHKELIESLAVEFTGMEREGTRGADLVYITQQHLTSNS